MGETAKSKVIIFDTEYVSMYDRIYYDIESSSNSRFEIYRRVGDLYWSREFLTSCDTLEEAQVYVSLVKD